MENRANSEDVVFETVELDAVFEAPTARYSDGPLRNTILPQQLFIRMVGLERRRAERSGRRLVLMLLKSTALLRPYQAPAIDKILLALSRSTRDTDITGWYQDGSILGVLFTEIAASQVSIVDTLSRKVSLALRDILGIQQLREIKLSFHVFPDDRQGQPGSRAFSVLYPDLNSEIHSKRISLLIKRSIDVVGSVILLLLLSPLLLLITAAVKLTSRGPVVFRQQRMGQYGKGFTFLKFRSMYTDTNQSIHEEYMKQFIADHSKSEEKDARPKVYKMQGDPRVTKLGAFLRRTSLDELPQLFNVLTGEMSLVGPRPPLSYEFASYAVWHRSRLMRVKPGITGYWQVHGRSRVKFDEMVRMDLQYARAWSLWLDVKILMQTPRAVFTGNGAY